MQKIPYEKYEIFGLANPRSGDGLASGFLTDYPARNIVPVYFDEFNQTIECEVRFYNVIEKIEREACLSQIANSINDNNKTVRRVICIMGGDGSLATTINFFRTSKVVDHALHRGKLSFVMLPFGTGNDGAQVFGWGASPAHESWLVDLESLTRDIITSTTEPLSLW